MSRVSISKSYAVLVGLEGYMKVKKRGREIKGLVGRGKEKKGEVVGRVGEGGEGEQEEREGEGEQEVVPGDGGGLAGGRGSITDERS